MPFTLAVRLIKMNKATVVGSHVAAYIAATEKGKQGKGIFTFFMKEREESLKYEHLFERDTTLLF